MFEEYMQELLGYRKIPNVYGRMNENYNSSMCYDNQNMELLNSSSLNMNMNNSLMENNLMATNIEECYPEIYKLIYPMVRKICTQNAEPLTEDLLNRMTQEIYSNIEAENIVNLNINIENSIVGNSQKVENRELKKETKEENKENRNIPNRRNYLLNDLIKILLIRELTGRPGRRPNPPRPKPPRPYMNPRMPM